MKWLIIPFLLLTLALSAQDEPVVLDQQYEKLDSLFAQFHGKVIYIDFWASWCKPCLEEMPHAKELQQTFQNKDVVFLYLAIRDKKPNWTAKRESLKLPGYHFFLEGNLANEARKRFGVYAIPHYAMIGKEGEVAFVQALPPSYEETENDLNKLLNE